MNWTELYGMSHCDSQASIEHIRSLARSLFMDSPSTPTFSPFHITFDTEDHKYASHAKHASHAKNATPSTATTRKRLKIFPSRQKYDADTQVPQIDRINRKIYGTIQPNQLFRRQLVQQKGTWRDFLHREREWEKEKKQNLLMKQIQQRRMCQEAEEIHRRPKQNNNKCQQRIETREEADGVDVSECIKRIRVQADKLRERMGTKEGRLMKTFSGRHY